MKFYRQYFKRLFSSYDLPTTRYGFPISKKGIEKEGKSRKIKERGVAIILALMIIVFMVGFVADVIVSSKVANQMSINIEEKSKADYMAVSGINLARFLILIDWGLDLFLKNNMKQEFTDGPGDIWATINGLPIGSGEVKMMADLQKTFDLSDISDEKTISQFDLFSGRFIVNVSDEDSKININYLIKENLSKKSVYPQLLALFSCPAEKEYLERKDLTPEKLATRIADYIDKNKRVRSSADYSNEKDPYSNRNPKHVPKNLPLDSLDEMKLIDGWDDDIHTIFSPYLTVYPIIKEYYKTLKDKDLMKFATMNINTGSRAFLGCLFSEMDLDCQENFARLEKKRQKDQGNYTNDQSIKDTLKNIFCYNDKNKDSKADWFKKSSSTFRIKVEGFAGDQTSEAETVIYRLDPTIIKKNKLEKATDLLYWNMR